MPNNPVHGVVGLPTDAVTVPLVDRSITALSAMITHVWVIARKRINIP